MLLTVSQLRGRGIREQMVGLREPPTDGGHLKGMCRGKVISLLKIEKDPEKFTSFINDVNICLLLKDNGQGEKFLRHINHLYFLA